MIPLPRIIGPLQLTGTCNLSYCGEADKRFLHSSSRQLLALACSVMLSSIGCFAQAPLEEPEQKLLPPMEDSAGMVSAGVEADYLLQAGDELTIIDPSLGGESGPYTTTAPVLPDGTVSIYPVGVLVAKGKTIEQLTLEVRTRAAALIVNPAIVISLLRMRGIDVYVLGNVINPGLYSVEVDRSGKERAQIISQLAPSIPLPGRFTGGQLTGLGAENSAVRAFPPSSLTVLTAIQMAGGVRESADIRHILIKREGAKNRLFDLWAMIAEGDSHQDFPLRAGDVIVVPRGGPDFDADMLGAAANRKRAVRVFGAVRAPGIYELTPRDDLLSIISRAGGFSEVAVTSYATLSRQDRNGQVQTFKLSIKRSVHDGKYPGRYPVMPGDVVEIKTSIVKQTAPKLLTIAGAFASAFFILYFSRIIVDQSQPQQTSSGGATSSSTSSSTSTNTTASNTSTTTQ